MNKNGLLTFTQYAAHRKVSKAAVSKAVQTGRITVVVDPAGGRFIDPKVADEQWNANSVAGQKSASGTNGVTPAAAAPSGEEPGKPKAPSYADSRAIREAYGARMAKLEFEEKMGSLVSAERARADAFKTARITRDALLSLPDKISHELAAEADPHTCHVILTKALIEALDQLVRQNAK